ncbi:MAG: DUF4139 domain-containing protein [Bryobacteraceae bacterium]|nr:DUF4139 domain-containing protein [Bryobacteraceae bacterium]
MRRGLLVCSAVAFSAVAAELPVREVILYKHGVGYFERSGELAAGESARLDFKADQMNDVLKSLTLETGGADKVIGLRYDASEPLERKLANYPIRLEPGQPLSRLLDQLKGARVELKFGAETVAGAVVSSRALPATEQQPEREQVTLLLDTAELRTLDLSAATSVRFADPELQLQLKDYLAAVSGARSQDARSVYIDSSDTGRRRITASYMIPTAVWKSSYRLIFGEAADPTLEGWAIVDNTTGDDWTNIRLALVSGRPISFVTQLYEPKYVVRPVAELPEDRAQAPVVHEGALGGMPQEAAMAAPAAPPPPPRAARENLRIAKEYAAEDRARMESTIVATPQARELGELFEYRFDKPVTVRKSESAMLPFLQQKVGARKLLIYADESSRHPMNAAEIANSTGKTLDGGPLTVFDSGAYAGEALMETLKTGDKRLISYGVDLGSRITTAFDSDSVRVREVHLRRGVLTVNSSIREVKTYTIRNVDQKAKTLVIEHPVRQGYRLLNQKPSEQTANAYRFEVKLAPDSSEKFAIEEERSLHNAYALANQTPDFLASFVENKEIGGEARKQLERILAQKRQIAALDNEIDQAQQQIGELTADQARLRENIASLNRVSGQQEQVQKYAAQLASQESTLASLRDRLTELRKKKTALEAELNTMIESMEF